ncbi:hypothetical protein FRC09_020744, partial [Ceratobasidium sp. 395]
MSRPSTAPTPTTDSAPPLLPASSPIPSRQPSPAPSPVAPLLSPAPSLSAPLTGSGSAPATAGIHISSNGVLDWPGFLAAYANGEWDPNRIPDPPMLVVPLASRNLTSPSPLLDNSALSSSSTVAILYSPSSPMAESTPLASLGGLVGPDRPRLPAEPRATSIASRRGTATPDLSAFKNNLGPYVHAPRKVQRSQSDVEIRSPGGVPSASTPALPSPSIDRAAAAATIRWAGSGVDLAPYALPSPEAAELLDPMRGAQPVVIMSTHAAAKSRLSKFWKGSPQDSSAPPPSNSSNVPLAAPQPVARSPSSPPQPKRASTTIPAPHAPTLSADYFSSTRSQSYRSSRSPSTADYQEERPGPSRHNSIQSPNPATGAPLSATYWANHQPGPSRTNIVDACAADPFFGTVISVAGESTNIGADSPIVHNTHLGNGYPAVPDHLLTSLSSSVDGAEFFTPSENL